MTEKEDDKERSYNILVYGIEKLGLTAPSDPITSRNFSLSFEPFNTDKRFNDYDGVILFQGIFENFELKGGGYSSPYLSHSCKTDQLDKRKKESQLLTDKGGFICFLLNQEFIDNNDGRDFRETDLAKHYLNYSDFYRKNFKKRITHVNCKSDDFRKFLNLHGAATSYFSDFNKNIDLKILATISNNIAAMLINRNYYFIPTLIPDNRPEVIHKYFSLLTTAITSSYNKLIQTLPDWINEFVFNEEDSLSTERGSLVLRVSEIDERHTLLKQYKSVLALTGDELAVSVSNMFANGFGIPVDTKDELREDFKLLDESSKPICLCEVKGTNKGVKREYINQTDSHRERSNFDADFPSLLIINTHIKNSRSIKEKDQEIAKDQILHAVKMNVLIMRTVDLLALLRLYLNEKLTLEEVLKLITDNTGWLRFSGNGDSIIMETVTK